MDLKSTVDKLEQPEIGNEVLQAVQEQAFAELEKASVPTTKDESWKYTNLKKVLGNTYSLQDSTGSSNSLSPIFAQGLEIIFVDGNLITNLEGLSTDKGITISTIANAFETHSDIVSASYGKNVAAETTTFVDMNTAFQTEGLFIHAKRGVLAETLITIRHILTDESSNTLTLPRALVYLEDGSSLEVCETFEGSQAGNSLDNYVLEAIVAEKAVYHHTKIQMRGQNSHHIGFTGIQQAKDSVATHNSITLGGGVVRNNLSIDLDAEYVESNLNGLYLLNDETHCDNQTIVDHKFANCNSNELYKGVMDGKSTGVFNGRIYVRQEAQKTNAFQSNNNILLTDDATIHTKPQLEIWADDVSCSHGATTGQLDKEALFYLRARGIGETLAKSILLNAFIGEVVQKINNSEVREFISEKVTERLSL